MPDTLHVRGNALTFRGKTYACAIGKSGVVAAQEKREGDGATPAGTWTLRECWYRADRHAHAPRTSLPLRVINPADCWCDDPAHGLYNRHFSAPHPDMKSFERLHREEHVYDLIVPLGYNDAPVAAGRGSAIFLHLAHPDYRGTEGCVALSLPDLLEILAFLTPDSRITIHESGIGS